MEGECDSNESSDYSLLGRMYKSRSVGEGDHGEHGGCQHGWDSGVGSDCCGADVLDMEPGDGEFASEGSGVLPSEPNSAACTCHQQHNQPDNVKVHQHSEM